MPQSVVLLPTNRPWFQLRAIGEVTDVVEKEMYTFDDRNGESLSLRPATGSLAGP
ncbi:hypothetical protein AADJ18_00305 [Erwinia amylovora]|uniref:hypothetical protein n=1 Tax=Erwinia amylovora TaxID=552 RepID=UPI0037DDB745